MGDHHSKNRAVNRAGTLNGLREQLYSLNMRMLLAMQVHDGRMEEELRRQMAEVQEEIDRLCAGSIFRRELERQLPETE